MRWSYSRLSSFKNCPYEFYLNYIINDPDLYPNQGNFYAENGSLAHETLEKYFKGEISLDEAAEHYVNQFDEQIFNRVKQSIMDKKFEACADYFATVDFDWLKDYEILGVELELHFKIAGKEFIAYIDLLIRDNESGDIIVIDHKSAACPVGKSGKVLKNHKETFESHKRQGYIYAAAVKQNFGVFPKVLAWNHFADGGKFMEVPFDENEYNQVMSWVAETISEIEKEEDFEPTLNFFYCTQLCGFRSVCEYAESAEWK